MSALTLDHPTSTSGGTVRWWRYARRWCGEVLRVGRERRDLADLDDHLLADIGLDRASVRAELDRPFWDLPAAARARLWEAGPY